MADDSSAISAIITHSFLLAKRIHRWAYTWRYFEKLLKPLDVFSDEIGSDIHFIQALSRIDLFKEGLRLFKNKWQLIIKTFDFIDSFFKLYVEKNSNWHESYDCFAPSTKNALEKFNLTIKTSPQKKFSLLRE